MEEATCRISAYLSKEELAKFNKQLMARGRVTVSGYIREMLGFDPRERGAPKGPRGQKSSKPKSESDLKYFKSESASSK